MRRKLKVTMVILSGVCAIMLNSMSAYASAGDGLFSSLNSLYAGSGSSSSGASSGLSGVVSSIVGSSGGSSTASMPAGSRRVITYYPLYNVQQQQQLGASQQAASIIRQTYDVSGNSVFSADVSGNTAINNQYNQWQKALTPDIPALESDPVGPMVNSTSLSEAYHEDYKIYEEKFGDIYTIYSNISNNTIVNHYVMFDIPSGVMARMTKDGRDVSIASKSKIEAEGTYNVQFFYAEEGYENVPAWQQNINSARFNFRIQYTAGLDGEPLEWDDRSELESFADLVNEEEIPINAPEVTEPVQAEDNAVTPAPAESSDIRRTSDSKLNTSYDPSSGYYKIGLLTGDSFYSSVPDGMVTNSSVIFQADNNFDLQLYRNGEQVEYAAGDFIQEDGNYTLIPVLDDVSYENYYRGNRPMLRFRIVTKATSDLSVFSAPEGMIIEAVRYDYEDITDKALVTYKVAHLPEDGVYEVDLRDDMGRTTVNIQRDTHSPKVTVNSAPNEATIDYASADIESAVLMKGETVISEGNLVSSVTEPGRYHLIVKDGAGNATEKDFAVTYRINAFAVLSFLAIIAIAVAVFLYIRRIRTNVRVR